METQFTPEQLVIISTVASVIMFVCNEFAGALNVKLGRAKLTAGLYVISLVLALAFTPQVLPAVPALTGDPAVALAGLLNYLGAMLAQLTWLVGVATAIYNILGQRILTALATRLIGA